MPVRQQGDVLALLWVLDDDEPLDTVATRTARACAERLRFLLGQPEPVDAEQPLARLFEDQEPPDLTDLVRYARLGDDRLLQFVVVGVRSTPGGASETTPPLRTSNPVVADAEARARRLVLTVLPRAAPSTAAHELVADRPSQVVGAGGGFTAAGADPGKVATLAARAIVAADCAAVDPALPASVAWDDLGLYRRILLTTRLGDWPGPQPVPRTAVPPTCCDHPRGVPRPGR